MNLLESFKKIDFDDFDTKKIGQEFTKTIKNSNLQILKCHHIPFNIKTIFKNIGCIIMSIIYLLFLISFFIFIIKERKKIDLIIKNILKRKSQTFINLKSKINILNTRNKLKPKKSIINNLKSKNKNNIKKRKSKINYPFKKKNYNKSINLKNKIINKSNIKKRKCKINNPFNKQNFNKSTCSKNLFINKYKTKKMKKTNQYTNKNKKEINYKDLNEGELNDLIYEIAVKIDKRTYCQYYCSLLKNEHLILFTFIQNNDYKFNIIYQIPQIIYTTLISVAFNSLLRFLSLSENNIINLKNENDMKIINGLAIHIKKIINIKFGIFYFLSNIFLLFFWYFISCFCAVYINTQIILFKDTISSFCVSVIYPFLISLFPRIFRIPAIRNSKQNRKCMYRISKLLTIL